MLLGFPHIHGTQLIPVLHNYNEDEINRLKKYSGQEIGIIIELLNNKLKLEDEYYKKDKDEASKYYENLGENVYNEWTITLDENNQAVTIVVRSANPQNMEKKAE